MRKYADIITDLKGGKTVEYEEARLAAIMAANLYFFAPVHCHGFSQAGQHPGSQRNKGLPP